MHKVAAAKSAWMPIESAPRNVPFLAYENGDIDKCRFFDVDADTGRPVYSAYCGQPVVYSPEPTHWMPAPNSPFEH